MPGQLAFGYYAGVYRDRLRIRPDQHQPPAQPEFDDEGQIPWNCRSTSVNIARRCGDVLQTPGSLILGWRYRRNAD